MVALREDPEVYRYPGSDATPFPLSYFLCDVYASEREKQEHGKNNKEGKKMAVFAKDLTEHYPKHVTETDIPFFFLSKVPPLSFSPPAALNPSLANNAHSGHPGPPRDDGDEEQVVITTVFYYHVNNITVPLALKSSDFCGDPTQ